MEFPAIAHSLAQHLIETRRLPGLVAAAFDMQEMDVRAYGLRDVRQEVSQAERMTPDTRFPVASITKTFTAGMVLQEAARGRIQLDAPMAGQLRGFRLADAEASQTLTPRDALCHFSGLPPHTWAWVYGEVSRATLVRERLPYLGSLGPHRRGHAYSNLLYAVLGALWEEVTGATWEDGVLQLAQELGLKQTGLLDDDWQLYPGMACPHGRRAQLAAGWQVLPGFVARRGHPIAPASEMYATAGDLARWGMCQLSAPHGRDGRWEANSRVADDGGWGVPLDYGLGWRLDRAHGVRRVWHSGQCTGYSLLLSLSPARGRGHVWAANASGVVDLLQVLDLTAKTGHAVAVPPSQSPSLPPPSLWQPADSKRLKPGTYTHPGYGVLTLAQEGAGIRVVFGQQAGGLVETNAKGDLSFQLPIYGQRMPLKSVADALTLPFEPAVAPIRFVRV